MKEKVTIANVLETWACQYPKVTTWLSKIQRKNHAAYHLCLYCGAVNKTPDELLALKENPASKEAERLLDQFVESSQFTNSVTYNVVTSVKSFYKHNYMDLAKASGTGVAIIKQKPYRKHLKEELLKIYRAAQNPRDRALITFTWSTSIAKESLIKGQWKHLDSDWEKQELPHISLPDVLIKGHGIGKYKGVEQHTFLTPEAKRDLIDYKDWLERVKGIKLGTNDPIFIDTRYGNKVKPLGYNALGQIALLLSKRSGVPFSWHDARRYVETALEEIRIHPNWARKIRGRKVKGEEAPYSRPAIEQLRNAYKEAVPLLQFTVETELTELKKRQEAIEQIVQGMTPEQREKMQRFGIRIGKKRETQLNGGQACENGEHCEAFEQINERALLGYLREGWSIIHRLTNGEVIVKR